MKRVFTALAVTLLLGCATTSVKRGAADLILLNGKVFTADQSRPWAEAVAIRGERIEAVGSTVEVRQLAGPSTRVIDLAGRLVIPGINDAHIHEPNLFRATKVDLSGVRSFREATDRLSAAARDNPAGWLQGELDPFFEDPAATRDALDAVLPSQPVIILTSPGGHTALLNSAGLREWSISDRESDPPGGWYGREDDGRLNGWLYEYAYWKKLRDTTRSTPDSEVIAALEAFSRDAARLGITSVQNMSLPLLASRAVEVLNKTEPTIRWRVIRFQMGEVARLSPATPRSGPDQRVRLSGIKYVLDGSPIERGAALRAPYADRTTHSGRMNFTRDEIARMLEESRRAGEPLLLHVAGDRAANEVLEVLRGAGDSSVWAPTRLRFEHGDLLVPDLLGEVKRLGIVVVQNPSHLMFPELVRVRYGDQRQRSSFPLRSLLDRGIPLALGSDGPLNPFLNIMFATMHPTNPAEALTREQAVEAYTRGSAYAEFAEAERGSLAAGMLADVAVLSQDIFTIPLEQLPATESVMVIVGGKVIFEK